MVYAYWTLGVTLALLVAFCALIGAIFLWSVLFDVFSQWRAERYKDQQQAERAATGGGK